MPPSYIHKQQGRAEMQGLHVDSMLHSFYPPETTTSTTTSTVCVLPLSHTGTDNLLLEAVVLQISQTSNS